MLCGDVMFFWHLQRRVKHTFAYCLYLTAAEDGRRRPALMALIQMSSRHVVMFVVRVDV